MTLNLNHNKSFVTLREFLHEILQNKDIKKIFVINCLKLVISRRTIIGVINRMIKSILRPPCLLTTIFNSFRYILTFTRENHAITHMKITRSLT